MKDSALDPRRLDVRRLARDGATIAGHWSLTPFARLLESCVAGDDVGQSDLPWRARGELRAVVGAASPQTWLHLDVDASVRLQCQRCLLPLTVALNVQRHFLFAADEAEAARLDEEIEDDVLVFTRQLDLAELAEDELILSLPLVPRHQLCPQPLTMPSIPTDGGFEALAPPAHPFAVLESLRRTPKGQS